MEMTQTRILCLFTTDSKHKHMKANKHGKALFSAQFNSSSSSICITSSSLEPFCSPFLGLNDVSLALQGYAILGAYILLDFKAENLPSSSVIAQANRINVSPLLLVVGHICGFLCWKKFIISLEDKRSCWSIIQGNKCRKCEEFNPTEKKESKHFLDM